MKRGFGKVKLIAFAIIALALFTVTCVFTAKNTFDEKKASESFAEVDYYSMQKYSDQNADIVFKALKSGNTESLVGKMISSDGIDELMAFADWSEADFKNAVGLGAGSLSPSPNEEGLMDMSERFFVDVGDEKYVIFVETLTSRWGRTDEGISAVAVTSYSHFDSDLDYGWCGEDDDDSVMAGKLFWTENQAAEGDEESQ